VLIPGQSLPADAKSSVRSVAEGVITTTVTSPGQVTISSASMTSLVSSPTAFDENISQTPHKSIVSTGGIVGIVLGVIAVVALTAGLFW
jgi:hypothetical protein